MKDNFQKAISFVFAWEGGYSNDIRDAGGETKFGICKRSYPNLDIVSLTREDAIAIYKKDYWDKCGCDAMTSPMDIVIFDTAVNCGVSRALDWFKTGDYRDVLLKRIQHYSNLVNKKDTQRPFLRGWINRVVALYAEVGKCG